MNASSSIGVGSAVSVSALERASSSLSRLAANRAGGLHGGRSAVDDVAETRDVQARYLRPFGRELAGLGESLGHLERLVAGVNRRLSAEGEGNTQRAVDALVAEVNGTGTGNAFGPRGDDFVVTGVSPSVANYEIFSVGAETRDVNVSVLASGQTGALYLSLGGGALNVGTTSSFTVEIGGAAGVKQLAFASGTTLADIANSIGTFQDQTGVTARVSGSGLVLNSENHGSSEFVSVRVISDGGIGTGSNLGIYQMEAGNANKADRSHHDNYNSSSAFKGVDDFGQNIEAEVNGFRASTYGLDLAVASTGFTGVISLSGKDSAHETLGTFRALQVRRLASQGSEPPGLDGPPKVDGQAQGGAERGDATAEARQVIDDIASKLDRRRTLMKILDASEHPDPQLASLAAFALREDGASSLGAGGVREALLSQAADAEALTGVVRASDVLRLMGVG